MTADPYIRKYRRLRWAAIASIAISLASITISGWAFWFNLACRAITAP